MPTATAKTPSPNPFKKAHARMIREARGRWRAWAAAIAAGGDWPAPRDILEAGAILGLAEPAAALEADAATLTEMSQAEKNIELCRDTAAAALAPFGGSAEGLADAVAAAQAEVERLKALYEAWYDGGSVRYWQDRINSLRRGADRLFAEGAS
jgi:hypothetical protein